MAERSEQVSTLQAREALSLLSRMSRLLNTGLDTESLSICIRLCEAGVHPEPLAKAIQEVRREVTSLRSKNRKDCNDDDSLSRQLL